MKRITNVAGFTLAEAIVASAILVTGNFAVLTVAQMLSKESQYVNNSRVLFSLQSNILNYLKNPASWAKTSTLNSTFDCATNLIGCNLSSTSDGFYDFVAYDAAGNKITYDGASVTTRYTPSGLACPAGTSNAESACPIIYRARWKPICQTYPCTNPTIEVKVALTLDTGLSNQTINPDRYKISLVRAFDDSSLRAACQTLNGLYNSSSGTCYPKYAGQSCAAIGKPAQIVSSIDTNGTISCSPLYSGQCNATTEVLAGLNNSGQVSCAPRSHACPVACVGSWGSCSRTCGGGTQTFTVTTAALNGGTACEAANGAFRPCNTQSCSIDCVGSWGSCSRTCGGGIKTYTITTPAAYGGLACPAAHNATQACNTQACPVDCSGSWSSCSVSCGGGVKTFSITTPASNGGAACSNANGDTQACNPQICPTNCSGSWTNCTQSCGGGTKTFRITTQASNGGAACSNRDGDQIQCNTQACSVPTNCAGTWSACNTATGTKTFTITQQPQNGGTVCPSSPQTCAVDCVGSWGACTGSPPNKTYTYSITAKNGGANCAYRDGQTDSSACVPPTYCTQGTYDAATNKCKYSETITDTLSSNTVSASACNDHHGLVSFSLTSNTSATVLFWGYSPYYSLGWNCGGRTAFPRQLGTLTLRSNTGKNLNDVTSFNSITVNYSSSGSGCNPLSGSYTDTDPGSISNKQGRSGYYVSLCPANAQQYPTVNISVSGSANLTINSSAPPTCPPGKTLSGGYCI